jgi:capsular polysaccharide transport system permease protein
MEDGPKGFGGDDSYAVRDYLTSRDALQLLLDKDDLREVLARGGDDWLWRFPSPLTGHTNEDLYKLYQSLVTVDYDSSSGVTTLRTEAFRADDAKRIASVLMTGAESLVNNLNERARSNAIALAQSEVTRNQQAAIKAEDLVTAFRDRESVIDPTQYSDTVLKTVGELSLQLVEARAQLEVTRQASPSSPQIAPLRARITAIQQQMDQERAILAGDDKSLAPRIAEYERLTLMRGFAEKNYVSALNLLEAARLDAQRQQAYVEQVVAPRAADEPKYPKRLPWIVGTFLVGCTLVRLFRPRA